jgi:hypothetical protein
MYDERKDGREQRMRSHSARAAILAQLAKGDHELTAKQIRAELPGGQALRDIYYHLRVLEAGHAIARDGERYKLS